MSARRGVGAHFGVSRVSINGGPASVANRFRHFGRNCHDANLFHVFVLTFFSDSEKLCLPSIALIISEFVMSRLYVSCGQIRKEIPTERAPAYVKCGAIGTSPSNCASRIRR